MNQEPDDSDELEKLCHLSFGESEGSQDLQDSEHSDTYSAYTQPWKLWKIHIGTDTIPKIASY